MYDTVPKVNKMHRLNENFDVLTRCLPGEQKAQDNVSRDVVDVNLAKTLSIKPRYF